MKEIEKGPIRKNKVQETVWCDVWGKEVVPEEGSDWLFQMLETGQIWWGMGIISFSKRAVTGDLTGSCFGVVLRMKVQQGWIQERREREELEIAICVSFFEKFWYKREPSYGPVD